MTRHFNLNSALDEFARGGAKHLTYLEVGTYDGVRASHLLKNWLYCEPGRTAKYFGFDLFEDLTKEMSLAELSKSKLPPGMMEVRERLIRAVNSPDFDCVLFRGNTRETLASFAGGAHAGEKIDLAFIDGGHSLETIDSDWANVERLFAANRDMVVILDDYYLNRDDYGCRALVVRLMGDPRYVVRLLDPIDYVKNTGLEIRAVKVTLA